MRGSWARSRVWRRVGVWGAALAVVGVGIDRPAEAHRRDFPFTYDWHQTARGEKEFESQTLYSGTERAWQQQFELEWGVTERFSVAPYLVFGKGSGEHLRYEAFKLESRYQLGTFATNRVLTGLYLEYEKPRSAKGEVEGKLIFSNYGNDGSDFSVNLIAEKALEKGVKTRTTYSFGYARPIGGAGSRGGFEWIRNLDDGRVNAGPVFSFLPRIVGGKSTPVTLGYAFPVTRGHGNRGDFRLLMEYEF